MKIEDNIITFKSLPAYFNIEKNGIKNNTVRIVTPEEKEQVKEFLESNWPSSVFIQIINSETQEGFYREIRDVSHMNEQTIVEIKGVKRELGYTILIFTWDENVPVCCSVCGKPVTPDLQIDLSTEEYGEPRCVGCE